MKDPVGDTAGEMGARNASPVGSDPSAFIGQGVGGLVTRDAHMGGNPSNSHVSVFAGLPVFAPNRLNKVFVGMGAGVVFDKQRG